jgi:hypothetical protein
MKMPSTNQWLVDDRADDYLIKAHVYDHRTYASYLERWLLAADLSIRLVV